MHGLEVGHSSAAADSVDYRGQVTQPPTSSDASHVQEATSGPGALARRIGADFTGRGPVEPARGVVALQRPRLGGGEEAHVRALVDRVLEDRVVDVEVAR